MEHLIQLVQGHPVLYDMTHPNYKSTKLKDELWNKISSELNYKNGKQAKEDWRKLRECHREALRRQSRKKSEQGPSAVRPWTYQTEMEFLLPHMVAHRSTTSNLSDNTGDCNIQTAVSETSIVPEDTENEDSMLDDSIALSTPTSSYNSVLEIKKKQRIDTNKVILKSTANYEQRAKARHELRQTLSVDQQKTEKNQDALYQFFLSMYHSTKEMPPSYQLMIRRKLFEAVSQAEEELLYQGNSSHDPNTTDASNAPSPAVSSACQLSHK